MGDPAIAYDMSRLFLGPLHSTPRGIDRIELGFAQRILAAWPGDVVGVLPTVAGMRVFDRARMTRGVRHLETMWRENIDPQTDEKLARVRALLASAPASGTGPPPARRWSEIARRQLGLLRATGVAPGRSARRSLPHGAVYFNAGHIGLTAPWLLAWLERRRDVRPVFMIHDLIPIERPEFGPAGERKAHERILASAARHAAAIIVPSHCVRDSVASALAERRRPDIPISALPLPVSPVFLEPCAPSASDTPPYFVVLGRLDARKNHALVFEVWLRLLRERGRQTPRLVILGSRGWGTAALADSRWSDVLGGHTIFVDGMSTPGVRELLAGAAALLAPSRAEGFGLPIVEALAVGTPVIASDIPAHREAGGDAVLYHDPDRPQDWLVEIGRILDNDPGVGDLRVRAKAFVPRKWPEYFEDVAKILRG